jgi:hypothetical protein
LGWGSYEAPIGHQKKKCNGKIIENRRDDLVAFSMGVRDEGVAPPKHSLRHRVIPNMKYCSRAFFAA